MSKRGVVLQKAIAECERFLQAAKAYKPVHDNYYEDDNPGRAAAKRASMDATKALAALRRASASDWSQE